MGSAKRKLSAPQRRQTPKAKPRVRARRPEPARSNYLGLFAAEAADAADAAAIAQFWPCTKDPISRSEYRQLYDFEPVIWMMLNADGIILDVSPGVYRLVSVGARVLIGTPLRMWVANESRRALLDHFHRCQESAGESVETEIFFRGAGTWPVAVRLCSKPSVFRGAALLPTVAIDISEQMIIDRARRAAETQRDRAEDERRMAQAAGAAKDRLIAMVSHELRNPLSPALMAA